MLELSLPSLRNIVSETTKTALRFPLPLACAVLFTALFVAKKIHRLGPFVAYDTLGRCLTLLFLTFFLFLSIALVAERRGWSFGRAFLMAVAGGAFLTVQVFWLEAEPHLASGATLFMGPALVLLVSVAPFLVRASDPAAFWDFNRAAWLGAGLTFLAALVVALGIVAALAAIESLFKVDIDHDIYGDVWAISLGLLWPWLALAMIPRRFGSPEGDYCPKGVAFIAGTILVPLAIAYLLILYAYIARILILWDLPQGQVAYIVAGYAGAGVATHLLVYPLRETGNRLLRLFHRHFYHALIAPVVLLAVGLAVRVGEYGVTEPRYLLIALALWLAAMALLHTFRPRLHIMAVPLSLALLLAATSFGPWGAPAISKLSQMARLEGVLAANGLLVAGKIVPAQGEVSTADAVSISSIVGYLRNTGKAAALQPWFVDTAIDFEQGPRADVIVAAMGLEYTLRHRDSARFYFYLSRELTLDITDFDTFNQLSFSTNQGAWSGTLRAGATDQAYNLEFDRKSGSFTVMVPNGDRVSLDVGATAERMRQLASDAERQGESVLQGTSGDLRVRLQLEQVNGRVEGGISKIDSITAILLLSHN